MGEYIINSHVRFSFFGHNFFNLSFFLKLNEHIHAYLGGDSFIFLCFLTIMSVERAKSRKPSFFDITPSVGIYDKKHKNIKPKAPKYAWMCLFNFRKQLKLKKL